jgi:ornithine--oxo-acid transaminase
MDTERYLEQAERYSAHNYHPLPVVLSRGEGIWVWDVEGNRYLDMLSAYSAVNQGHAHPKIVQALIDQAKRLPLTSRAFHNDRMGPFLEKLCDISGYEKALPMNTGAEAVETAIKAVRKWAYEVKGVPDDRAEILVFSGNFHGRTTTVISFSADELYKKHFGPLTPGFRILPYGDLGAVRSAMSDHVAGILVEPIQGEAGVVVPPEGFLQGLRSLCDDFGAALIADEIQTGLGRTGRLFACDWDDIRADVMIVGKALGGGVYPVSAIMADGEIMDIFTPGTHGSTFGGNPTGAAVGMAALDVIMEEKLAERADELGQWFMDELRKIESPVITEVRGRGLMVGVVLNTAARPYCEALQARGMLAKETHENVVRFAPPLIIEKEELEAVMPDIAEVLSQNAAALSH